MIQKLFLGICILIYRTLKYIVKGFLFIISLPFQFLFFLFEPKDAKVKLEVQEKKQLKLKAREEKRQAKLLKQAKHKEELEQKKLAQREKEQRKKEIIAEEKKNKVKVEKKEPKKIDEKKAKKLEEQKRIKQEKEEARRQQVMQIKAKKDEQKRLKMAALEEKRAKKKEAKLRKIEQRKQAKLEKEQLRKQKLEEENAKRLEEKNKIKIEKEEKLEKEQLKKQQLEEEKAKKIEEQSKAKTEKEEIKRQQEEEIKVKKDEQKRLKMTALEEKREKKKEAKLRKIEQRKQAKLEKEQLRKQKLEEKKAKRLAEQNKVKSEKELEREKKKAEALALKEQKKQMKNMSAEERKAKKAEIAEIKRQKLEEEKNKKIEKIREENRIKEEKAKEKVQEKERKKQEKLQKIEDKKKAKEQKKQAKLDKKRAVEEAKRKNQEAYINENASMEKPNTFAVLSDKLKSLNKIPKKIAGVFVNNSFVKNARNRRDINRRALLIDFEGEEAKKSDVKLVYEYEAKNKEGKFVKGYFEAYSRVEVHSFLLSEGYEVYSIKTNKWITLIHGGSDVNKVKFKSKDLIFFLAQLSTYLKAGITLVDALRILSRQFVKQKKYEKIFRSIIYELTMGESFSSALEKQNVAFPKLLINMIKTAEMTGELPEVLDDMVDYYTEIEETRRQFITAMTYPTIVGIFALGVITFILMFVVPRFVAIYDTMDGTQIPTFTRVVMNVSFFLQNNIIKIGIGIVLVIALWLLLYKKNRFFRTLNQWAVMHIPAIGDTMIYSEVATFTKTFGSLLAHNVPIPECLEILNKITNNEIYKMMILDVVSNLAKGGKISDAFEGNWAFPIPAYEMICTGEATGELPDMLAKVSSYYQSLEKTNVTRIKTFIEPILTIFLTVIVGIIILAVIIPMFNLYQSVQNMPV